MRYDFQTFFHIFLGTFWYKNAKIDLSRRLGGLKLNLVEISEMKEKISFIRSKDMLYFSKGLMFDSEKKSMRFGMPSGS